MSFCAICQKPVTATGYRANNTTPTLCGLFCVARWAYQQQQTRIPSAPLYSPGAEESTHDED